ncbi:MAG: hypothetical protein HN368_11560 [Spirochaetales bacterium]|jgi:hypothetical protein|nr:hypothetical protein [Spirochaetales bacterium]
MNSKSKTICLAALLICGAYTFGFTQSTVAAVGMPSARTAAVGGVHAASSDDLSSIFANPAGFISAEPMISLAEITVGVRGPIFDIAGIAIQGMSQDISALLASESVLSLVTNLFAAVELLGPINFGYLGRGLGFGFFNTTDIEFSSKSPLTITGTAREQVTLAGGYAFRIPLAEGTNSLDIGFLLKGSLRGEVEITKTLLELPDLFTSISFDTVTDEPFLFTTGMGIDAGIRFAFSDVFSFGIVGKDLYTPTMSQSYPTVNSFIDGTGTPVLSYGLVPLDLTAGLMFSPRLGRIGQFINELAFMADYSDILDFLTHPATARNPILHASLGAELRMLEILMLRAGFNDGLFAAGLGIDLSIVGIHIAMYGNELSTEPGIRPIYNAQIGIELRF